MKRFELAFALVQIPVDAFMLFLAALAAYFLRFESIVTDYRPVIFELDMAVFLQYLTPVVLIWLVLFALSGLYHIRHPRKILIEIKQIFVACALGFGVITILIFLRGELFNSRFIVLAATVLAFLFVTLARLFMRFVKTQFYKMGFGIRRVLLIGGDRNAEMIDQALQQTSRYGLEVVETITISSTNQLPQLVQAIRTQKPDVLLQASVSLDRTVSEHILDLAREHHLEFHYAADLFETKASNTAISTIGDVPVLEIKETPLEGWGRIYKRLFDLIIGGCLLLVSLPIMGLIALAIKATSKGPILYKNHRIGKNGKPFILYKFRRLKIEYCTGSEYDKDGKAQDYEKELIAMKSHREGPLYKIASDPRSTKVGAFLEKTSLDELPQFFNVLIGNMSLVGPRPHQEREVDQYQKHHKRVLAIKPGITGLAQISGRSDLDFEEEVRLDTFYIENWSIRGDLAILLKTPFVLFRKRK